MLGFLVLFEFVLIYCAESSWRPTVAVTKDTEHRSSPVSQRASGPSLWNGNEKEVCTATKIISQNHALGIVCTIYALVENKCA